MLLQDVLADIQESCDRYNKLDARCANYAEYSFKEYETNLKEAELKVLTEGGSESDLIYLEAEAKEGFIVRSKNIIGKLTSELKERVSDIKKSVTDYVNDKETQNTIKAVENLLSENPSLDKKSIEILDADEIDKIYNQSLSEVDSKLSKYKAGHFSPNDREDLDNMKKKYDSAMKAALGTVVVASAAAVIISIKNAAKKAEKLDNEAGAYDANSFKFSEDASPEDVANAMEALRFRNRLITEYGNYLLRIGNKGLTGLKAFKNAKKAVDTTLQESREEILDAMLNNIMEKADIEHEIDSLRSVTPEQYLEMMEEELFN